MRLLLENHEEESLTVYTDVFRSYDPLEDDEKFQREAVIHGEDEYVDGDVNTCESHASRYLLMIGTEFDLVFDWKRCWNTPISS